MMQPAARTVAHRHLFILLVGAASAWAEELSLRAGRGRTLLSAGRGLGSLGVQRRGSAAARHSGRGGGGSSSSSSISGGADATQQQRGPVSADFFEDPQVYVGELPASSGSCHAKCVWECEHSECSNKCKPNCQAPKCMTACQEPQVSECQQICEDPKCAVICPSGQQCERGGCPGCHTVCGEPRCRLDCGRGRFCRSTCADPVCSWACEQAGECQEPRCSMKCETPPSCGASAAQSHGPTLHEVYAGAGDGTLDATRGHAVEFAGREVAWQGLAKVQAGTLLRGPLHPEGPLPPTPVQRAEVAKPMEMAKSADEWCAPPCACEQRVKAGEIRIPETPC